MSSSPGSPISARVPSSRTISQKYCSWRTRRPSFAADSNAIGPSSAVPYSWWNGTPSPSTMRFFMNGEVAPPSGMITCAPMGGASLRIAHSASR